MTGLQRGLTVAGVLLLVALVAPKTHSGSGLTEAQQLDLVQSPVRVSGTGQFNTPPFDLQAGNYSVSLLTGGTCFYSADLTDTVGHFDSLATTTKPGTVKNNIYTVRKGQYYVSMTTGPSPSCPWTLDLVKQ